METRRRPQDPLVPTKASALSSAPPHMRDGAPGHLFTPMESSKPAQGPSARRAQARPSCALFIAVLRKRAWQDPTHRWNPAGVEDPSGKLQPSPGLLALARVGLLYLVEIGAVGAQ